MTPAEYEEAIISKALSLCRDQHPAYNIEPLMGLIRKAWPLGYDIVRKERTAEQQSAPPSEGKP